MNTQPTDRAYESIPHLPGSRMTAGDHTASRDVAAACLEPSSVPNLFVVVQEKLDGSCLAVWREAGELRATARSGRPAAESPTVQHRLFALWVERERERFLEVLRDGERIVGEWLALAHGTRYDLPHEPFVAFDLIADESRLTFEDLTERVGASFVLPRVIHTGPAMELDAIIAALEPSGHGALDRVEGAVWRAERGDTVQCVAKWVRPDKLDGCLLPGNGRAPHWNWRPDEDWMWAAAGGYSGRG